MLRHRLLTAFILITSVSSLLALDVLHPIGNQAGIWMIPVGLFFACGTAWEFASLARTQAPVSPFWVSTAVGCQFLLVCIPNLYVIFANQPYPTDCPIGRLGWLLIGVLTATSVFSMFAMRGLSVWREKAIEAWSLSTLIAVYVGVAGTFLFLLRNLGDHWFGTFALVASIAVTKFGDAGAYFTGRSIGKRKLCPSISPGKTVAGAVGAVVTSTIVSMIAFCPVLYLIANWHAVDNSAGAVAISNIALAAIFGAVLAVVGLFGDLAQSSVKRAYGAKDSGNWLPGLGGVWDVMDSILPAVIVAYFWISLEAIWTPFTH